MVVDPWKSGVGQSERPHTLTLTSQVVNDPMKGPVYNPPPKQNRLKCMLTNIVFFANLRLLLNSAFRNEIKPRFYILIF